jgi:hypothetical protein
LESIKQMEGYSNPTVLNGSAGNSAPVVGGKRKLKLVTRKAARKALKKLGMKMRGGAPTDPVVADAKTDLPAAVPAAGGRRRHGGKTKRRAASRRRASLFGL